MRFVPRSYVIPLLAALWIAPSARAADVLIMNNGDRITGTLKKIWDGKVHIEPAYAGEILVDLDKVKTIDARRDREFELWSGQKFTGQLGVDANDGQVVVRDGRESPLDLAAVEEVEEPKTSFEWASRVDLNGNSSSGNSDTRNLLVQAYGMVRFGDHRHTGNLAIDLQDTENVRAREQIDLRYDYNWLLSDRWYVAALAGYQRDPVRDLSYRFTAGAAVGYEFFDDAHRHLRVSLGPAAVKEELAGRTTNTGAALWKLDFRHKLYRNKLEFFHLHDLLLYTGGTDNRIFTSSTGLRMAFTDDFYTNLQFDYGYESEPAPGKKNADTNFILGVGLKID